MDLKNFCKENGVDPAKLGDIGEVSDGYHTFNSLYHQRMILFATIVNLFPGLSWKSRKHSDGEEPFGGGWFIVGIKTPEGQYTYHYENKDWDIFQCKELETAPEWDGHTDKDVERVLSIVNAFSDGPAVAWASNEVELAIKAEKADADEGDWEYGATCYESALRAFKCLMQEGHSGFSIQITKSILNRMIDGRCLTPIEESDDIWEEVIFNENDPIKHYQCKRMSSLFKEVAEDGTVTYSDVNRVVAVDVDNPNSSYQNGFVTKLIDKIFPITMPYLPPAKKYTVVRDECLVDPKNGDFDTTAYLEIITPEGKKLELNRYFKEVDGKMVQIEKAEFDERKAKRVKK